MSELHKIKRIPKEVPEEVKKYYINDEGQLLVNLNSKVPALQDLLIKLYYYEEIKFIFEIGKGKIFSVQLMDYIKKIKGWGYRKIRETIKEMEYYRLIVQQNYWNSNILILTAPSYNFFNANKMNINTNVLALIRMAYTAEHFILYEPHKRKLYREFLVKNNIISKDRISYLEERLFITIQKVSQNKQGHLMITFAILDTNKNKTPEDIVKNINVINSYLPLDKEVFFKINVCVWDLDRYNYLNHYWKRHNGKNIKTYKLRGVEFTDLNIKRFFDYQARKIDGGTSNV